MLISTQLVHIGRRGDNIMHKLQELTYQQNPVSARAANIAEFGGNEIKILQPLLAFSIEIYCRIAMVYH